MQTSKKRNFEVKNIIINQQTNKKIKNENESLILKSKSLKKDTNKKFITPIKNKIDTSLYKKNLKYSKTKTKSTTAYKSKENTNIIKTKKIFLQKNSKNKTRNMNYKINSSISCFNKNLPSTKNKTNITRDNSHKLLLNNPINESSRALYYSFLYNSNNLNHYRNFFNNSSRNIFSNSYKNIFLLKKNFNITSKKKSLKRLYISDKKIKNIKKCQINLNMDKSDNLLNNNNISTKASAHRFIKSERIELELNGRKQDQNTSKNIDKTKVSENKYKIQDFSFKKNCNFNIFNKGKENDKFINKIDSDNLNNNTNIKIKVIKHKRFKNVICSNILTNYFEGKEELNKDNKEYDTPHFTLFDE